MRRRLVSKSVLASIAKKGVVAAAAVGLAMGVAMANGVNAWSATTTNQAKVDFTGSGGAGSVGRDGLWTMPAEVKGTYCVNFNNSTTPLGNPANDNFTYTIPAGCNVCKDSTVKMVFDCAEVAVSGCSAKLYLVADNGTSFAEATVQDCSKPVSELDFTFTQDIQNLSSPLTLYLSTADDSVVPPTICFTDQCKVSDFYTDGGQLPSGQVLACLDSEKHEFANRIQQFNINNVLGPRKDIIALDGICPRSHFAGKGENISYDTHADLGYTFSGGFENTYCCTENPFTSTDRLKLCDVKACETYNGGFEDPINNYSVDLTLTTDNPNNLKAIESVTLDNGTNALSFTPQGNEYVLNNITLSECCNKVNTLAIKVANKCPGTLLEDGDFILTAHFNFGTLNNPDLPYANASAEHPNVTLLTHHWVLEGWEGVVPYLSTFTGYKTFMKIFNDYVKPADVYVDIFPDNGNPIYNVKIGQVGAKQVGLFWASDILQAAGLSGQQTFAMRVIVDAPPAFVHGLVVQKGTGGDRVIPIDKASSYKGQIPQFIPAGKGGGSTE